MPFRQHTRLNDECLKRVSSGGNTLYEPGFVLQNSYNHYDPVALSATTHFDTGSEYLPMKRSVSCSVCLLCESNTRMRGYDTKNVFGGGMKKYIKLFVYYIKTSRTGKIFVRNPVAGLPFLLSYLLPNRENKGPVEKSKPGSF